MRWKRFARAAEGSGRVLPATTGAAYHQPHGAMTIHSLSIALFRSLRLRSLPTVPSLFTAAFPGLDRVG